MPTPDKPSLDYSYTAFQESQGDNSFPGTQLDNDLANLKASIDETIDFATKVIRSDGSLNNAVVTKESLSSDIYLGLAAPRPWATATEYTADATITHENGLYICENDHTSSDFAVDLAAGRWTLLVEFTVPVVISPKEVKEVHLDDQAVSTRALALDSVTYLNTHLSLRRWLTPVGAEMDFSGPLPPIGWLWKNGDAISRVTYNALFSVLTVAFTGNTTSGSTTVSALSADLRFLGLEGSPIEGPGVPNGTTIVSVASSSLVLSQNATATATSAALRVFPCGNGDGVSTFNLPDDRDKVDIGRGNMGGVPANIITATGDGNPGLNTSQLGAAGGVDRHTLAAAQVPQLSGSTTSAGGHAHSYDDATAATEIRVLEDAGGSLILQGATGVPKTTGTAGAHGHSVTVNSGGGQAHPNVQPSRVVNKIIFTGNV